MTNDDFKPGETVEEAIERYTTVVDSRIAQLTAQRDEAMQYLWDIVEGFDHFEFICTPAGLRRITMARAALLNSGIYARLEAAAEQRARDGTART